MDNYKLINTNVNQSRQRWFITGATGFVGREFIRQLLSQGIQPDKIIVLVRAGHADSSRQRFTKALSNIVESKLLRLIQVIEGDVTENNFGLTQANWDKLKSVTHIIHMAALTRFDADLKTARRHNVRGVKHIIELAIAAKNNSSLKCWVHVSTAYVAGSRTDKVWPDEKDYGGRFRNTYEQSKYEAEQLLMPFIKSFPLTIYRPSIIVGRSDTGAAGNCNTVYWAIRHYLSGQKKLYANADTPLDLVPVDYVVSAICNLINNPHSKGKIIPLAGGDKTTVTLAEFAHYICDYLDSPPPELINPAKLKRLGMILKLAKLSKRHRGFIEQAQSYLPYFSQNPRFDTSITEHLLADSSISVPYMHQYIDKLLDYCLQQSWGRRSKMPGRGYRIEQLSNG